MHAIFVQIRPFAIRWYGLMIALGCFAGLWLARKGAERNGIGREKVEDFFLYAVMGAVLDARLYYVAFTNLSRFWQSPFSVFAIWEGGLAILGGLVVAVVYTRRHRISFGGFADTLAPARILGKPSAGSDVF